VFVRNSVRDVEKELSELDKRISKIEKELLRVERLEKALAEQEITLAKKITDLNRVEQELEKRVHRDDFEEVKKELKKIDEHETILVENAKSVREIINELGRIKSANMLTKQQFLEKVPVSKEDIEEKLFAISDAITDLDHIRATHKKKAGKDEVETVKKELHERMSQLEYQNKLLLAYLKKVDELLQEKL